MIRVCIVCEGQTEVEFVKNCLAPYLLSHEVLAFSIATSVAIRQPSGWSCHGGALGEVHLTPIPPDRPHHHASGFLRFSGRERGAAVLNWKMISVQALPPQPLGMTRVLFCPMCRCMNLKGCCLPTLMRLSGLRMGGANKAARH